MVVALRIKRFHSSFFIIKVAHEDISAFYANLTDTLLIRIIDKYVSAGQGPTLAIQARCWEFLHRESC